jgi:hypothetical protein
MCTSIGQTGAQLRWTTPRELHKKVSTGVGRVWPGRGAILGIRVGFVPLPGEGVRGSCSESWQ